MFTFRIFHVYCWEIPSSAQLYSQMRILVVSIPILDTHDESLPLVERANMVQASFRENGDGESRGMTYPFIAHCSLGVWPSAEASSTEQAEWPLIASYSGSRDNYGPAVGPQSSKNATKDLQRQARWEEVWD